MINRKQMISHGLKGLAASSMLPSAMAAESSPKGMPHHRPRAKRVIQLIMAGGPSQIDMFDYKPILRKFHGQDIPDSVRGSQRLSQTVNQKSLPCIAPMFDFHRVGQNGSWINKETLPHMASIMDDITLIKSMHCEAINHDPGLTALNTGTQMTGKPSIGSWVNYGLGSSNPNLPGYMVLVSKGAEASDPLFSRLWGSGFLPSKTQGVSLRSSGDPILYISDPAGLNRNMRRSMLDGLNKLNHINWQQAQDPEIIARNHQFEMAYRMQSSVPELMDLSSEPESVFEMYGEDSRKKGSYAANCLLARRMAERDVPFVQIYHRGWDHHKDLPKLFRSYCKDVDQATTALIKDLKRTGLLEDTLVVFTAEFGRTVFSQGEYTKTNHGRDHHGRCFTSWVAGGGMKAGFEYGKTDDWCYNIVENPVHINDLNATILHCLGIDHEDFTYRYQGLDQRLTGVDGARVVHDLLA